MTSLRDDVLASLPAEFTKAIDIWRGMGRWARVTVKHTLNTLHGEGLVERHTEQRPDGVVHLYRRPRAS